MRGTKRGWYERAGVVLQGVGVLLYVVLDEIAARTRGVSRAVAAFLGLAFLLAFVGTWGFAELASSVLEGETQRFDEAVLQWTHAHATPLLDQVALEVTALGAGGVLTLVLMVASALLWVTGHRYSVLLLWVAVVGSIALTLVLKLVFGRPRPALLEWRAHYELETPSFPSGHAMGSMVAYATVAYLIARLQATRRLRRLTLAVAAVLITLIGASRVYLGVHYPSDVIAGYAIGLAWASLCVLGLEALRYLREGRIWLQQGGEGPPPAGSGPGTRPPPPA